MSNAEPKLYHELWIHREMLRDTIRCEAYQQAISKAVQPGDVALDIGTGTGIQAMFAAMAGAKKVYAVDRTSIARVAQEIVSLNGLSDKIQVIEDDIVNIHLPEKVDVITAEWMGGFGVDENLLGVVLQARDKWLKEGGAMVPAEVTAWIAPVWDPNIDENLKFWQEKPYGLDLSLIGKQTVNEIHNAMHHIQNQNLLVDPVEMWRHDCQTFPVADAEKPFHAKAQFTAAKDGKTCALTAWFTSVLWADVTLSNAPNSPTTHWGRTVLPLSRGIELSKGDIINIEFICTPQEANLCHTE
ncbi:MAG: hypothetical protein D3923_17660, partial [Candidatus Electrothrix sp. AR3]|nr:hypothetical protein [Candidatus Electrothrix sp. AR3]